jgi:hypothetical protein
MLPSSRYQSTAAVPADHGVVILLDGAEFTSDDQTLSIVIPGYGVRILQSIRQ